MTRRGFTTCAQRTKRKYKTQNTLYRLLQPVQNHYDTPLSQRIPKTTTLQKVQFHIKLSSIPRGVCRCTRFRHPAGADPTGWGRRGGRAGDGQPPEAGRGDRSRRGDAAGISPVNTLLLRTRKPPTAHEDRQPDRRWHLQHELIPTRRRQRPDGQRVGPIPRGQHQQPGRLEHRLPGRRQDRLGGLLPTLLHERRDFI